MPLEEKEREKNQMPRRFERRAPISRESVRKGSKKKYNIS